MKRVMPDMNRDRLGEQSQYARHALIIAARSSARFTLFASATSASWRGCLIVAWAASTSLMSFITSSSDVVPSLLLVARMSGVGTEFPARWPPRSEGLIACRTTVALPASQVRRTLRDCLDPSQGEARAERRCCLGELVVKAQISMRLRSGGHPEAHADQQSHISAYQPPPQPPKPIPKFTTGAPYP
jgi:hypothetical protein